MQHGLIGPNDITENFDWRNDPVQDLLVILDQTRTGNPEPFVRLHFRTWSSRGRDTHPEAAYEDLDIEVDRDRFDGTGWHIMGHLLAVVVRTGESAQHLLVENWKAGVTILVSRYRHCACPPAFPNFHSEFRYRGTLAR